MRMRDVLLYEGALHQEKLGDHVNEVSFDKPVCISQVVVSNAAPGQSTPNPVLRIFAKDLLGGLGARYCPVVTGTISCSDSASSYKTEVLVTDHVVIRGRFQSVNLKLLGKEEFSYSLEEEGLLGVELPSVNPSLDFDQEFGASDLVAPGPLLPVPSLGGLLPLAALPSRFLQGLLTTLSYWKDVGRSHLRISQNPPRGLLKPVMTAADTLVRALRGETDRLSSVMSEQPPSKELMAEWTANQTAAVDMAVGWCQLLVKDRSTTFKEIEVGLAGLASTIILSSNLTTLSIFFAMNGGDAVAGLIDVQSLPPPAMKYLSHLLELITITGGPAACEVMLGRWAPMSKALTELNKNKASAMEDDAKPTQESGDRNVPVKAEANGLKEEAVVKQEGKAPHDIEPAGGLSGQEGEEQQDTPAPEVDIEEYDYGTVGPPPNFMETDEDDEGGPDARSGGPRGNPEGVAEEGHQDDYYGYGVERDVKDQDEEELDYEVHDDEDDYMLGDQMGGPHQGEEEMQEQEQERESSSLNGEGGPHCDQAGPQDSRSEQPLEGERRQRVRSPGRGGDRGAADSFTHKGPHTCPNMLPLVLEVLLHPLPSSCVPGFKRTISRLQTTQVLSQFQSLIQQFVSTSDEVLDFSTLGPHLRDIMDSLADLVQTAMQELEEPETATEEDVDPLCAGPSANMFACTTVPDPYLLSLIMAYDMIPQLAIFLHSLAVKAQGLREQAMNQTAPGGGTLGMQEVRQCQMQLQQLQQVQYYMVQGAQAVLALMMSHPYGVQVLLSQPSSVVALIKSIHPTMERHIMFPPPASLDPSQATNSGGTKGMLTKDNTSRPCELVLGLSAALVAGRAVQILEGKNTAGSKRIAEAVFTLVQAFTRDASRGPAILLLTSSREAMLALVRMMSLRVGLLRVALGREHGLQSTGGGPGSRNVLAGLSLDMDDDEEEDKEQAFVTLFHPEAMYAGMLLLEVFRDPPRSAYVHLAAIAGPVKEAVRQDLEAIEKLPAVRDDKLRRTLKELQGYAEPFSLPESGGWRMLLAMLDEVLPRLVRLSSSTPAYNLHGCPKNATKTVDPKLCLTLMRAVDKVGSILSCLALLTAQLDREGSQATALEVFGSGGLSVLERCMRTSLCGMLACNWDQKWALLAGDAQEDLDKVRYRAHAVRLVGATASAMAALVRRLGTIKVKSSGCLEALLEAHGIVSTCSEGVLGVMGEVGPGNSTGLLEARRQLTICLSCWLKHEWEPQLLRVLLGSVQEAEKKSGQAGDHEQGDEKTPPRSSTPPAGQASSLSNAFQSPSEMFCALTLLGDLVPSEWPPFPLDPNARNVNSLPPPSHRRKRATLCRLLEPFTHHLRQLISFGAASECRMVRCMLVRFCCKAAGLGGGMGTFLAQPLLEELNQVFKSGQTGDGSQLGEGRRVLEILVPLCVRPAMKAAFLDLKAVSRLSKYLVKLMSRSSSVELESLPAVTMVLEGLTYLCNPDISLNPLAPRQQRLLEDCPCTSDLATMVSSLLAVIHNLGPNAQLVKNLVLSSACGLSSYPSGRTALKQGVVKWYVSTTAARENPPVQQALTWASSRLWEIGEHGGEGDAQQVKSACTEIAEMLEQLASRDEENEEVPHSQTAPTRFAAAVQAALSSHPVESPDEQDDLSELLSQPATCLAHDSACQAFWKYVKARAGRALLTRKLVKWEVKGTMQGPPSSLLGEGLVRRKRPRDMKPSSMGAAKGVAVVDRGSPKRKLDEKSSHDELPDIPTVVAPRRREGIRPRATSSSRPPSMHVDDFQRQAGASTMVNQQPPLKRFIEPTPPGPAPPKGPSGPPQRTFQGPWGSGSAPDAIAGPMPSGGPGRASAIMRPGPSLPLPGGGGPGQGPGQSPPGPRPPPVPMRTLPQGSLSGGPLRPPPAGLAPPSSAPANVAARPPHPAPQPGPSGVSPSRPTPSPKPTPPKPAPPTTPPPISSSPPQAVKAVPQTISSLVIEEDIYGSLFEKPDPSLHNNDTAAASSGPRPQLDPVFSPSLPSPSPSTSAVDKSGLQGKPSVSLTSSASGGLGPGLSSDPQQALLGVLKDPAKLKKILETNPQLAILVKQHLGGKK